MEEESFAKTIDQGLTMLQRIDRTRPDAKVFSGERRLYALNDTYGFPLDLTKEILAGAGHGQWTRSGFRQLMQEQQERARNARKDAGADAWKGENTPAGRLWNPPCSLAMTADGRLRARCWPLCQDGQLVESAHRRGRRRPWCWISTPFYGEGGGQVGDSGVTGSGRRLPWT